MPKIICGNCSQVVNLSKIPNSNELEYFAAQDSDRFISEVIQEVRKHPDIATQIACFSELWGEQSQSLFRCPHCHSLLLVQEDGTVDTYAKLQRKRPEKETIKNQNHSVPSICN